MLDYQKLSHSLAYIRDKFLASNRHDKDYESAIQLLSSVRKKALESCITVEDTFTVLHICSGISDSINVHYMY